MKKYSAGILLPLCSALLFSACQKEAFQSSVENSALPSQNSKAKIFYGSRYNLGNGEVRSFLSVSDNNKPLEVGVIMSSRSMLGLPEQKSSTMLDIPQNVKSLTAFDHILIDWNPMGRELDPVYGIPHFNFYFYMIGMSQVASIVPGAAMEKLPPPGFVPDNYLPTTGGVTGKGKRWLNINAPELKGLAFTKTFNYGSYNGNLIFYEPIITRATLLEGKDCTLPFGVPTLFSPINKWYPTEFGYKTDSKTGDITVSLSGFVWRGE
jgi:hypothetical protein